VTGRERLAYLANMWAKWIGPWDERGRYHELGKATLEALSHGEQLDALCTRIADLEAERDAAKAGEARAVEALKRIREELETIAAGKEEEVRNDFSSGESHGWGSAYLHVCRIIGNAATQPALDWLAQREREAAARELEQLMESEWKWEEFELKASIHARIAALTNQQPTACSRSEVRGKERFRA
jgi:hypothetical protein